MPALPRIDQIDHPPKVGEVYAVPTVRGICGDAPETDWPIIGPPHDDRAWIGTPVHHAHVDARFLSVEDFCRIQPMIEEVADATGEPIEAAIDLLLAGRGGQMPVYPSAPDTPVVIRPLACARASLPSSADFESRPWFPTLCAAFAGQTLGPDRVCPHKGAPLGSIPAENGIVRCPLHGLAWDLKTGRLVTP